MDQVNMFLLLAILNLVTEPQRKGLAKLCGIGAVFSFLVYRACALNY